MTTLALVAVAVAVGTWLGNRWAEASQQIERDLARFQLTMSVEKWEAGHQNRQHRPELPRCLKYRAAELCGPPVVREMDGRRRGPNR